MAIENDELNRLVTAKVAGVQEEVVERALRPRMLDEYVGQEKIRGQLSIFIEAARKRRESLDHVLLFETGWLTTAAVNRRADSQRHAHPD